MNRKNLVATLMLGAALFSGTAFADCDETNDDAKRRLADGKAFEAQGKKLDALFKYKAAQGYFCETANPYEDEAARRAAPLGQELGAAAEKRGELEFAMQRYEAGGQFAAADRVLMQMVRAAPDSADAWMRGKGHFQNREGSFFSNNRAALAAAGAYTRDPKYLAELDAMPGKAYESLLKKENAAFNPEYLRDTVQLHQSGPDDQTDVAAVQKAAPAYEAYAKKWKGEEYLKASRGHLNNLRHWAYNSQDKKWEQMVLTKVKQTIEMRATTIRTSYNGSPELLEEAMDYYRMLSNDDQAGTEAKLAAIRSQARQLGDEANAKKRYVLAMGYYRAAGDDAKAKAIENERARVAMQKMQPAIDQAQKQADALKQSFSDPAKVEEMKRQAQEAAKAMQEDKAAAKAKNKKAADDLEKELGL